MSPFLINQMHTLFLQLSNAKIEGVQLTEIHGENASVLQEKKHGQFRAAQKTQVSLLRQFHVAENEQTNIDVEYVDLWVLNQYDIVMAFKEEQASFKQAKLVPKSLIGTLQQSKMAAPH